MHFSQIELKNWKNFTRVEVPLRSRAFLIGPNASGKSNFLDAFKFLRDLAADGLEKAVSKEHRGGIKKLRSIYARQYSAIEINATLQDSKDQWRYLIEFKQDKQRHPHVIKEVVESNGKILVSRPDNRDKEDPTLLQQTHLEQLSANQSFRSIAEAFKSIRYLHIVPQIIREQTRVIKQVEDPYGSDFLEHIWRVPQKTRNAWLKRIEQAVKAATPQLEKMRSEKDDKGVPHFQVNLKHWRPQGFWQDETDLSDGTLRLIGLLWALLEGRGLLLLEEPELSLHSEIIRHLAEMMALMQKRTNRQIMVSTHSMELLSNPGIPAEEIFLLTPGNNGTMIQTGAAITEIKALMEAGLSAAEAAIPHTVPENVSQLSRINLGK